MVSIIRFLYIMLYSIGVHSCLTRLIRSMSTLLSDYSPYKADIYLQLKQIRVYRKLLKPMHANQGKLIRVGDEFDGGYVCHDSILNSKKIISIGIGDNDSWETDLVNLNKQVTIYQFDHTINYSPSLPNFRKKFFRIGLNNFDVKNKYMTLTSICNQIAIQADDYNTLKIDIEGNEWKSLKGVSGELFEIFDQIIIEFHDITNMKQSLNSERIKLLETLNKTHQILHLHANNDGQFISINGENLAQTIEVTYLNRKNYSFSDFVQSYPRQIDNVSNIKKPDYFLGYFYGS
jgi:hypothetical protein